MEWISFLEKKPQLRRDYLIIWDGYPCVAFYDRDNGKETFNHFNRFYPVSGVSYWMAIPDLPGPTDD